MSKVNGNNSVSQFYNNSIEKNNIEKVKNKNNSTVENVRKENKVKAPVLQLSRRAQELLEKLRKTYKDMDFMIADFANGDDAKAVMSQGTKEISVLFSSEELEKMASSEKYEKEYMDRIQGALRMSERINKEFGFETAFGGKKENSKIIKIGIAFGKDGSITYFAELEKATQKQREYIEKVRGKSIKERKEFVETEKKVKTEGNKRIILQAGSEEKLVKKIMEVDWSKVKEDKGEGNRFDYSI